MQVHIKEFEVEMAVKAKGIEFEVRTADGSAQHGDCYLTMSGLTWCKGKTSKAHGLRISWDDFMEVMKSDAALKAAVRAAEAV